MGTNKSAPAALGVVGATGYTGLELLRLLRNHDGVRVGFATSEGHAGEPSGLWNLDLVNADDADLEGVDVVFLCLPHGKAVGWAERALAAGARVIDLTADHRPGSGREADAVYGMADLAAERVAEARLVANPGCYPTGVTLALHPLQELGVVDASRPIVVNAASGVTGAGRSPKRELLFAEVAGDYRPYAVGNGHRHLLEMREALPGVQILFQPHLLPVPRGILETIYVPVAEGVTAADLRAAWRSRYATAPTVRVTEAVPALADIVGTDLISLGAADNLSLEAPLVTVVVALDNLGKGAAGQAVHNMNLLLGQEPTKGLRC